MNKLLKKISVTLALLAVCGSVSATEFAVTLTCGVATATTVPLSWDTNVDASHIKNITITIDEGHPIVLTQVSGIWPTSYTAAGLSKGTEHNFVIDVYYDDGGSVPLTDNCSATTLNTSGCVFTSSEKETKDESWKDKCDFPDDYVLNITTTTTVPLALNVVYTKPSGVSNPTVTLGAKHYTGDAEIIEIGQMNDNGDGTYSLEISTETLNNMNIRTVGDSILIGVKNAVSDCTPGNMYCTKLVGYALGIGCNEPYTLSFSKRNEDQRIFSIDTNVNMIRLAVRKLGDTGDYTYYTLDSESSSYTLNISDFATDTYEFVIYDKNGITSGVKVLHAIY